MTTPQPASDAEVAAKYLHTKLDAVTEAVRDARKAVDVLRRSADTAAGAISPLMQGQRFEWVEPDGKVGGTFVVDGRYERQPGVVEIICHEEKRTP